MGYAAAGAPGLLNDLWEFKNGQWIWVSGSKSTSQPGAYGTLGVPSAANVPGARVNAMTWIDSNGTLWLFGGFGLGTGSTGALNDLWEFSAGEWTWVSGASATDQEGNYGTQGLAAAANVPGGRQGASTWLAGGDLWLFGGSGFATTQVGGLLADLWKFSAGQWTRGERRRRHWPRRASTGRRASPLRVTRPARGISPSAGSMQATCGYSAAMATRELSGHDGVAGAISGWGQRERMDLELAAAAARTKWEITERSVREPRAMRRAHARERFPGQTPTAILGCSAGTAAPPPAAGSLNDLVGTQRRSVALGNRRQHAAAARGTYGVLGVAAAGNVPGAREGAASWIDANWRSVPIRWSGPWRRQGRRIDLNDLWCYTP